MHQGVSECVCVSGRVSERVRLYIRVFIYITLYTPVCVCVCVCVYKNKFTKEDKTFQFTNISDIFSPRFFALSVAIFTDFICLIFPDIIICQICAISLSVTAARVQNANRPDVIGRLFARHR